jgi:hypothetical protein
MSFSLAVLYYPQFLCGRVSHLRPPVSFRPSFVSDILLVPRSRIEAARHLRGSQPLRAAIVRATATMSGTQIAPFRPSAPPPSLLTASTYMTCIFSMSINVHMFMVNFPPLPSCSPPKMLSMRGNVGDFTASALRPSSLPTVKTDCPNRRRVLRYWPTLNPTRNP